MAPRAVPNGSVVLSPEGAQALFAVINRSSGTINWVDVANDIGTTAEVARERYMRVLSTHLALGLLTLANDNHTEAFDSSDTVDVTAAAAAATTTSDSTTATGSSNHANLASTSNAVAASTSSNATGATSTTHVTKISDLRPRALQRMTGDHRACCFHGYRWCCYVEGCFKHTQCGYDLRVHFRKDHHEQGASFDFARLVHRTKQEAEAWVGGEDMDED